MMMEFGVAVAVCGCCKCWSDDGVAATFAFFVVATALDDIDVDAG